MLSLGGCVVSQTVVVLALRQNHIPSLKEQDRAKWYAVMLRQHVVCHKRQA